MFIKIKRSQPSHPRILRWCARPEPSSTDVPPLRPIPEHSAGTAWYGTGCSASRCHGPSLLCTHTHTNFSTKHHRNISLQVKNIKAEDSWSYLQWQMTYLSLIIIVKRHFETKRKKSFKNRADRAESIRRSVPDYEKQTSTLCVFVRPKDNATWSSFPL